MITPEDRSRIKAELTTPKQTLDPKCQAVVVLSAAPKMKIGSGLYDDRYDEHVVNTLRVRRGVEAWKLVPESPLFVVDGEDEVVDKMARTATELGVSGDRILNLPCGEIGVANTLGNMRVINQSPDMKKISRITFVTSQESGPRVLRIADMMLDKRFRFMVLPLLCSEYPHATIRILISERRKIIDGADPSKYKRTSLLFPNPSRLIPENELVPFNSG